MTKINLDHLLNELQLSALNAKQGEKFHGRSVSKASPDAISIHVKALNSALESPGVKLTDRQCKKLAHVFFDSLANLSDKVFDRKSIQENSALEKQLADIHQPGMHELRDAVQKQQERRENGEVLAPSQLEADLIEQEAKLAIALGVKPTAGAGAMSNSYFLHNLQGKKIAIFKPDIEGARGKKNPKLRARINTLFAKKIFRFLSLRQMRQRFSETFTFKASLLLKSPPVVPPSKISTFEGHELGKEGSTVPERGSLQILVAGPDQTKVAEAKDILKIEESPSIMRAMVSEFTRWLSSLFAKTPLIQQLKREPILSSTEIDTEAKNVLPKTLFHVMAFLDFATGQIDRHYGNFMMQVHDPDAPKSKIGVSVDRLGLACENGKYLVMIDNGAALGRKHPKPVEARNMYLFSELALAQTPFLESLPTGFPEPGWDDKLRELFLSLVIEEDLHDLPSLDASASSKLLQLLQNLGFMTNDRKAFLHAAKEKLFPEIDALTDNKHDLKKLKTRLGKVLEQLRTMNERLEVLKVFIDPPKGHEEEYTLQLLGSVRTAADYKAFWKMHAEHLS